MEMIGARTRMESLPEWVKSALAVIGVRFRESVQMDKPISEEE